MAEAAWLDRVFCEDCIAGMRARLPERSVDVVVTSPPYNIGVRYNTHQDDMPFDQYLDWMGQAAAECRRVLRDDGSFFLNIGDRPSDELRSLRVAERVIAAGFRLQNTIHWVKSIAAPEEGVNMGHYKPVNSARFLNNCHEYIFHLSKSGSVALDNTARMAHPTSRPSLGRRRRRCGCGFGFGFRGRLAFL